MINEGKQWILSDIYSIISQNNTFGRNFIGMGEEHGNL